MNKRKILENLKYGDVLRFGDNPNEVAYYFIVEEVENKQIRGAFISTCHELNRFTLDELIEKPNLSIAKWKKLG